MPLSDFQANTEKVVFGSGEKDYFEVRAISLPDVAMLIDVHEDVISLIVTMVRENKDAFENSRDLEINDAVSRLLGDLIRESPLLVANLIAICADEPTMMTNASRLPVSVQIDAVSRIAKLTFTDLASVKKLIADVMSIIRGILPPEMNAAA